MTKQTKQDDNEQAFIIQRIYSKDLSFESPNVPEIFKEEWKPEVNLDVDINTQELSNDDHEVVLKVTATTKLPQNSAFLVEVNQAGIFTIKGFDKEQLKLMLGSFCPNILFPYARETISNLINRGSFPPLYLSPIDFHALYQQQLEKDQAEKK